MSCIRHSFPRGSKGIPGRKCQNCSFVEGADVAPTAGAPKPAILPTHTPSVSLQTLPEHSPLGASSAERWMNCSGSVALIAALKTGGAPEEAEPDYRTDG